MQKVLLLVDGSSFLYRAYHAMPDLRSPKGKPTGVIFGVLKMLKNLIDLYPKAYLTCVFDAKGKTFRHLAFKEYKANRPKMPDDLACQIEPLYEAIGYLGWPLLSVEGIEADDVIGTLSLQAKKEDFEVIVATADKDLAQIVDEKTTLLNTMSGEKTDRAYVIKKYGVPPEKIIDYLSIVGDSSDNIPGVLKAGPKTAVKWLTEYETLENLMANAQNIKGVVGENLRKATDFLPQAKMLVTIKRDCELPVTIDSLVKKDANVPKLKAFYEACGFKTWLKELEDVKGAPKEIIQEVSESDTSRYQTIFTTEDLFSLKEDLLKSEMSAIDTETTSLSPLEAKLVGISLATKNKVAYIPIGHTYVGAPKQLPLERIKEILGEWLEGAYPKVGHNIKYDKHILENAGINLKGIKHDTALASYVLMSNAKHNMDDLALKHLHKQVIRYEDVCGKGVNQITFDQVDIEKATRYAAEDAEITLALYEALVPQIKKDEKLSFIYEKIEMPTAAVLQKIERNGVLIDSDALLKQSFVLAKDMSELEEKIFSIAGESFNLNSPKQLAHILFEKLEIPVKKKTPSGAPSTNEEVLHELSLNYPLPAFILDYRSKSKLKSTYTDKLPKMVNAKTKRVHTNFAQTVAVTGRLASTEPNLQNIPVRTEEGRKIREAFIAKEGHLIVSADYSQIELKIMAHISEDPRLIEAFQKGEDIHKATASEIFNIALEKVTSENRRHAKTVNFGLIYGMSAFGLAKSLDITREAAQSYIDRYFERYPKVLEYMEKTRQMAHEKGYVETIFGRRLFLTDINAGGQKRQAAERAAINAPMQGTAADIIKLAMIAVDDWLTQENLKTKMILQVHDEIVFEVPLEEKEIILKNVPLLMEKVVQLQVPLVVDIGEGPNWEKAH